MSSHLQLFTSLSHWCSPLLLPYSTVERNESPCASPSALVFARVWMYWRISIPSASLWDILHWRVKSDLLRSLLSYSLTQPFQLQIYKHCSSGRKDWSREMGQTIDFKHVQSVPSDSVKSVYSVLRCCYWLVYLKQKWKDSHSFFMSIQSAF